MEPDEITPTLLGDHRSESIAKLALALSKAQKVIKGAVKDSSNPFFKSSYADLSSVWDACHDALNDNEIAVIQLPSFSNGLVTVETMFIHSSGEWISSKLSLPTKANDAQSVGMAVTYGRRYGLSAMSGVCPADDDGEAAMGRKSTTPTPAITKTASASGYKPYKASPYVPPAKIDDVMKASPRQSHVDQLKQTVKNENTRSMVLARMSEDPFFDEADIEDVRNYKIPTAK